MDFHCSVPYLEIVYDSFWMTILDKDLSKCLQIFSKPETRLKEIYVLSSLCRSLDGVIVGEHSTSWTQGLQPPTEHRATPNIPRSSIWSSKLQSLETPKEYTMQDCFERMESKHTNLSPSTCFSSHCPPTLFKTLELLI